MDFHKLQQTLNNIEPSDKHQDIERLKQAALGNNTPVDRSQIAEPQPVAQAPILDEAAQFAALAGIPLSEKQKSGKAGQARGSDPMPKTSTPSTTGEQPHPLKDKLVGDSQVPRVSKDEDLDEGPWDTAKAGFKQGYKDYNHPDAIKKAVPKSSSSKKSKGSAKQKATSSARTDQLTPEVARELASYDVAFREVLKNPALKKELLELLVKAVKPSQQQETLQVHESTSHDTDSIKKELYRRLNKR